MFQAISRRVLLQRALIATAGLRPLVAAQEPEGNSEEDRWAGWVGFGRTEEPNASGPGEPESRDQLLQAIACLPSARQLDWQRMEFTGFVHFGPNSFTDLHWGTGKEDPNVFHPTELDTEQWVRAAKAAGMKMLTLTAKHHDGFCLWPSRFTQHSVAQSSWRGGNGDVLRELATACRKHGLRLGVYLSPADIVEAIRDDGRYGNGSEVRARTIPLKAERPFADERRFSYEVDDYNAYFMSQLYELLTEYGPVHQVWFDGAHPSQTKRRHPQSYQTDAWYDLIRKLAPEAVISINGPDTRWCGNEAGYTRAAEWSVIPVPPSFGTINETALKSLPGLAQTSPYFPEQHMFKDAERFAWYPAETNTTVRPGWFYASNKKPQFDRDDLLDIWYRAVGGNSVFLLNLAPDTRGLVPEEDVRDLERLGEVLRETFATDLAQGGAVRASDVRAGDHAKFGAGHVLDPDPDTYWMADDWTTSVELVITLPEPRNLNRAVIQEAIGVRGQRIKAIALDAWDNGKWREIGSARVVGYKRILRFADVTADKLRLRILDSRVCPTVSYFGLFRQT